MINTSKYLQYKIRSHKFLLSPQTSMYKWTDFSMQFAVIFNSSINKYITSLRRLIHSLGFPKVNKKIQPSIIYIVLQRYNFFLITYKMAWGSFGLNEAGNMCTILETFSQKDCFFTNINHGQVQSYPVGVDYAHWALVSICLSYDNLGNTQPISRDWKV